jgi:hypothetical protein
MPSFRLSSKQFWKTFKFTPIFLFQGLFKVKFCRIHFSDSLFNKRRKKLRQRHKIYFYASNAVLFILPFINVIFITNNPTVFFNCHVYSSLPVVFIIVGAFTVFWSNDLCTFVFLQKLIMLRYNLRKKVNKWVTNSSCDLRFWIKCGKLSPLDGSTI